MPELQPFPLVTRSGRTGRVFRASRFLDRSNVNRVEFDDGTSTTVLASELHVNPDGTFVLDDEPARAADQAAAEPPASDAPPPAQRGGGFLGNISHGPTDRGAKSERPREEPRPAAPLPADQEETLAMETSAPETVAEAQPQPAMPPQTAPAAAPERIERSPADRHVVLDEPLFAEDVDVQRVAVNRLVDRRPETRQEGDITIIPVIEEVITIQKRLLLREEVRITRRRTEVREPRRVLVDNQGTQVVGSDGRNIDLK